MKNTKKYNETKKLLDESIVTLMHRVGVEKLTIEQICKESNISRTNFYYYYKSKEAVISSLFRLIDDYFDTTVRQEITFTHIYDDLITYARHYFRYTMNNQLENVKETYVSQIKIGGEVITSFERPIYQLLIEIIDKGQSLKEITSSYSSNFLADWIMTSIRGVTFNWCSNNAIFNLEERGIKFIKLNVKSILLTQPTL